MSENKFTPGPWKAGWSDGITGPKAANVTGWRNYYPISVMIGGLSPGHGSHEPVAFVCTLDPDHLENANLIASAPDLLEALEGLLDRYTQLINCGDCGNWDPETEKDVIAARAAIHKARGKV